MHEYLSSPLATYVFPVKAIEEDPDTSLLDVSRLSSVLDTSMTSTMEPSLFSGGGFQRSNSLDDNYSIIGSIPEEGEEDDGDMDNNGDTNGCVKEKMSLINQFN